MRRPTRASARPVRRTRLWAVVCGFALVGVGPATAALPVDLPEVGVQQQGSGAAVSPAPAGEPLEGLFRIDPGECDEGGVTSGSYFQMVSQNGTPEEGPYFSNTDSPCGDNDYTPLRPGSDGGLITGDYQPHPEPAYSATGQGQNDRITAPQAFFGVDFATATEPTDPQTGIDVPASVVTWDGNTLDGDLRSFTVAWNRQHFNQGSPKPSGERPGNTAGPTGTFDPDTGRFTLTWSSEIEDGPFDGFTGVWHLEGTFEGDVAGSASGGGVQTGGSPDADAEVLGTGATAEGGGGSAATGEPTPRTGAPVAWPAGMILLAVAGFIRMLAVRERGR